MTNRLVNLIIASLVVCSCAAVRGQTQSTPREIINAMLATYKTASSYQDTGSAIVVETDSKPVQSAPHVGDILVSYRTYFVRPNMFRFDWKSPRTRLREASVWSNDGKKPYLWTPEVAAHDDSFTFRTSKYLDMAIMDAGRSSAGAVWPLISLFIKEASVMSFADHLEMATELVLVREEPVDGEMCFAIKASFSGVPWTLWIAKQRKIIRKTRTVYSYGSFDESVETGVRHVYVADETRRDIRINEPISKAVFNYRPTLRPNDVDLTR